MTQRAADLLVACLEANGFRRAFGVPGESYLDLLDALVDSRIDFIACRHEGGAAMAAAAHGQFTGEPGLCMVTRGPGATNASAGLHLAMQGGLPMLLLIGQIPRGERHRATFQEIDYERMLGEVCKWTAEIDIPERIPEYIARAASVARTDPAGPVALALPEDMLGEPATGSPASSRRIAPVGLTAASLDSLRALLAEAARPLLILGGIGWNPEASAAIGQFAESGQIPVFFGFRAQDCLDNEHPCASGPMGIGGDPRMRERLLESDLVIALGVRLFAGTIPGEDALLAGSSARRIVHFHPDPLELGRVLQPDLAQAVNPALAATQLGPVRVPMPASRANWRRQCREAYKAWSRPTADAAGYLGRVIAELDRQVSPDTVICNGAGNFAGWLHRYHRYRQPGTSIGPVSGSMGYDLPAALAVALERPDRQVVAWAGDGSFLMTGQELATAAQYRARILVIVCDNGLFGTIRMHQERAFPGRVSGTEIVNPDFAALARSYGAHAERADDLDSFRDALARGLASKGPSLIHLPLDPRVLTPDMVLAD